MKEEHVQGGHTELQKWKVHAQTLCGVRRGIQHTLPEGGLQGDSFAGQRAQVHRHRATVLVHQGHIHGAHAGPHLHQLRQQEKSKQQAKKKNMPSSERERVQGAEKSKREWRKD